MKRFTYILLLFVLFQSCDMMFTFPGDQGEYEREFVSPFTGAYEQIMVEVYYHINYEYEAVGKDYIKSPKESYYSKLGDCEDFTVLMAYAVKQEYGFKMTFASYKLRETDNYRHMVIVGPDDVVYDPTMNRTFSKNWLDTYVYSVTYYDYDYYMGQATNNWNK